MKRFFQFIILTLIFYVGIMFVASLCMFELIYKINLDVLDPVEIFLIILYIEYKECINKSRAW